MVACNLADTTFAVLAFDQTFSLNMPDALYQFVVLILGAYTLTVQHKTEHDLN